MAEIVVTEAAVKAAAEKQEARCGSKYSAGHLTWRDFADSAREDLEAAAPLLQVQVDREALERVLATHRIECTGPGEVTCRDCRDKGWMSWSAYRGHVADAILAALLSPEETK